MSTEVAIQFETVTVRGQAFTVRELTYGEMADVLTRPKAEQNLALLAVAVSNGTGEPLGGAQARGLPWSVALELLREATRINGVDANDGEDGEDGAEKKDAASSIEAATL